MRVLIADFKADLFQEPKVGLYLRCESRRKTITLVKRLGPSIFLCYSDNQPFLVTTYVGKIGSNRRDLIASATTNPQIGENIDLYILLPNGNWFRSVNETCKSFLRIEENLFKITTTEGFKYYVVVF